MWRLLNGLFGWHYAHLENTADSIVRRVRKTKGGERYATYYGGSLIFVDRSDVSWTVTDLTDFRKCG